MKEIAVSEKIGKGKGCEREEESENKIFFLSI